MKERKREREKERKSDREKDKKRKKREKERKKEEKERKREREKERKREREKRKREREKERKREREKEKETSKKMYSRLLFTCRTKGLRKIKNLFSGRLQSTRSACCDKREKTKIKTQYGEKSRKYYLCLYFFFIRHYSEKSDMFLGVYISFRLGRLTTN